jgi:hypothetical protein
MSLCRVEYFYAAKIGIFLESRTFFSLFFHQPPKNLRAFRAFSSLFAICILQSEAHGKTTGRILKETIFFIVY